MEKTDEMKRIEAIEAMLVDILPKVYALLAQLQVHQLQQAEQSARIPGILAGFWEKITGEACGVVAVEEAQRIYEAHVAKVQEEIASLKRLVDLSGPAPKKEVHNAE